MIVWIAGGSTVLAGHMSVGTPIAFQSYLGLMYGPIRSFSQLNIMMQNAMTNIASSGVQGASVGGGR